MRRIQHRTRWRNLSDDERKAQIFAEEAKEASLPKKWRLETVLSIPNVESIMEAETSDKVKALIAGLYLTGCRVSELLSHTTSSYQSDHDSIGERLICTTMTEKNKSSPSRTLVLPCYGPEKKIADYYKGWLKMRDDQIPIFGKKFDRKNAYYYLHKITFPTRVYSWRLRKSMEIPDFRMYPHYLRHVRITHLQNIYRFSPAKIMAFAGWSNLDPLTAYTHLDYSSLGQPFEEYAKRSKQDSVNEDAGD